MKYSSTKKFEGSKDSSYYDEDYFLRSNGSMYGKKSDEDPNRYRFFPYTEEYQYPHDRMFFTPIARILKVNTAIILGCARGFSIKVLREIGVNAIGVDISEYAVMDCASGCEDYIYCGDICDLSAFNDKQFDIAFAMDVFEHIRVPDLYKAIDEATRVASLVFIGLPVRPDDTIPDQSKSKRIGDECSHVSVYSVDWWMKQFYERGYVPIIIRPFNNNENFNILFCDVMSSGKYVVTKHDGKYALIRNVNGKEELLHIKDD